MVLTGTTTDGQTRFRNEIIANRVLFLDRTPREGSGEYSEPLPEGGPNEGGSTGGDAPAGGDAEDLPW
ncbi:MAG: hypothetical protein IIC84_07075 [Chloroflexi bacterium]|nr:hypothetical protein [Chloroflexota bacterium]